MDGIDVIIDDAFCRKKIESRPNCGTRSNHCCSESRFCPACPVCPTYPRMGQVGQGISASKTRTTRYWYSLVLIVPVFYFWWTAPKRDGMKCIVETVRPARLASSFYLIKEALASVVPGDESPFKATVDASAYKKGIPGGRPIPHNQFWGSRPFCSSECLTSRSYGVILGGLSLPITTRVRGTFLWYNSPQSWFSSIQNSEGEIFSWELFLYLFLPRLVQKKPVCLALPGPTHSRPVFSRPAVGAGHLSN